MIIGTGCDLIDIRRIERLLARFGHKAKDRLFTPAEQADVEARAAPQHPPGYAKRFAAKEAFSKALGTGIAQGFTWQDAAVVRDAKGKPCLELSENAWRLLEHFTGGLTKEKIQLDLSLSDEYPYAQAFVIISRK